MTRTYSSGRLELIRERSYALWERDGRPDGRAEEYWLRAEVEVEAECLAVIEGKDVSAVLPLPLISRKPVRRFAFELEERPRSAAA